MINNIKPKQWIIMSCFILLGYFHTIQAAAPTATEPPNTQTQAQQTANLNAMLSSAINKAGRQRMLSQRLGKAYAMTALNVEPKLAARLAADSESLFIRQLGELRKIVPTTEIVDALNELEKNWLIYKNDLAQPLNKENAQKVYLSGEVVLQSADKLTKLYEKHLGTSQANLVNVAGRERMLSQRMARAYFFKKIDIPIDVTSDLNKAQSEFVIALNELENAPENTKEINQDISLAKQQWDFFQEAINGKSAFANKNVATTSERILEQMNVLTERYEKIVK